MLVVISIPLPSATEMKVGLALGQSSITQTTVEALLTVEAL